MSTDGENLEAWLAVAAPWPKRKMEPVRDALAYPIGHLVVQVRDGTKWRVVGHTFGVQTAGGAVDFMELEEVGGGR